MGENVGEDILGSPEAAEFRVDGRHDLHLLLGKIERRRARGQVLLDVDRWMSSLIDVRWSGV